MTVPYVPTPRDVAIEMLRLANVRPGEVVVDPGAGECNIVVLAATIFNAIGIGIEINPALVRSCIETFEKLGLKGRAYVVWGDLFDFNYSIADVITLYLGSDANEKIRLKLSKELRRGSRVVSHDFEVPGWRPIKSIVVNGPFRTHRIYLYII
ncbi:SAM-dependent methyltransferase [Vulcanisaeta sp. JCM 16159]|uniref:SAM-dependent methyltransferase n=1 Tax=Vulcanisaeta sp. JCM 16159 TaxID=1295371 RepID=UPI0006D107BA|nr:SAM-dependent methyltransferase [Vulcanisaeta sp. JCM 16159]